MSEYIGGKAALKLGEKEPFSEVHLVQAAVHQNSDALEYASPELRADRELVLAAVDQNGGALRHASPEPSHRKGR